MTATTTRPPKPPYKLNPQRLRDNVPAPLKDTPRWIVWDYQWKDDKWDKPPVDPRGGYPIAKDDPKHHLAFEQAIELAVKHGRSGVGFVFSGADAIMGIDIDKCVADRAWSPWADELLRRLNTYTEYSPSGRGVKCFVFGSCPADHHKKSYHDGAIEAYDTARYFTVTGERVAQFSPEVETRQEGIEYIYRVVFGWSPQTTQTAAALTTSANGHASKYTPTDDEVFEKLCHDEKADRLLRGDASGYGSQSEADAALIYKVRFYAADADQVLRLCERSPLKRDKWYAKRPGGTWIATEIQKALSASSERYDWNRQHAKMNGSHKPATKAKPDDPWERVIPLSEGTLPSFPVDALPPVLRDFVAAASESYQVPADLPAMLLLAAIATCCQKRIRVVIYGDHKEPLNLWVVVVLESGERKSAIMRIVLEPIREYERELVERSAPQVTRYQNKKAVLEARIKSKRDLASKSKTDADRAVAEEEADRLTEELHQLPAVHKPQILVSDVTTEAFVSAMHRNRGRIAAWADEGGLFDTLAGRYGKNAVPNFDAYLDAYSGTDINVDRKGRDSEYIKQPAATVALTVQNDVLRALSDKPGMLGRGLIGRFLFSTPTSRVGYRRTQAEGMAAGIIADYRRLIHDLLAFDPAETIDVPFSPEAATVLRLFAEQVEIDLRPAGRLSSMKDWGAKIAGQTARIAGLIHCVTNRGDHAATLAPVEASSVHQAVTIGRYLVEHAAAAYGEMSSDPCRELAARIISWITDQRLTTFTKRDAHHRFQRYARVVKDIDPALELLCKTYHIRPAEYEPGAKGGRPREVFEVNPGLLTEGVL